ncbi:MAG TPA: heparinase II/III family protein [Lacunisphaera sp.]|nr:heparinase II/III family protein [Lacunisphaera sp.]
MFLSRRQFLERTALAAGVTLVGGLPAAAPTSSRVVSARERYARVADFINRRHPELRAKIVAAADEAMRGLLMLPGSSRLSQVGNPPAWLTPQHQDEEFLWGLNRMMHWKTLLQARALAGDERYAQKVAAELDDWIARAVQPPLRHGDGTPATEVGTNAGPPPWRALETGIRLFDSWPVVFEQLDLANDARVRLAGSVTQHAAELSLLSPRLWPEADHNHYFMEMLGLLAAGVYFPGLPGAGDWTDQAMRELERCVAKQFTADGGHIEACPTYHNVCLVLLARFLDLAAAAGRELPASVHQVAAATGEQTLHSVRPTGRIVPWGDSTRSNHVEAALWLYRASGDASVLQYFTGLMGAGKVEADCAPHLWDVDDPAALFALLRKQPAPRPLVRFDRGNDQVMMRTSWQPDALSVFFSCHSPLVPGSGHQHIDLGGFDFTAFGKTIVPDAGVFTYREDADRKQFKSAEYHSVLTIDDRGPFEYVNRWRYTPQKEGRVIKVRDQPGRVRIDSLHRNYEPAICHRSVALLDGKWLAVIDLVTGLKPSSTVQIWFHLDSLKVTWDAAKRRARADDDDVKFSITTSKGLSGELVPGRISEQPDVARPSTRLKLSDNGGLKSRLWLTVLAPWRPGEKEPVIGAEAWAGQGECAFIADGTEYRFKMPWGSET